MTFELGRLARWLRLLGFDTVYVSDPGPRVTWLIRALQEDRIVVTRDRRLAGARGARKVWVGSDRVRDQLREVLRALGERPHEEGHFTRCLKCNSPLEEAKKPSVRGRVPDFVFKTVEDFVWCPRCDQIFWAGTHLALAEDFLKEIEV